MAQNGRLIDIHQHYLLDEYKAALATLGIGGSAERSWPDWSPAKTDDTMAKAGIDCAVMSIASPGTYFGDIDFTKKLVATCNDGFARLVGDNAKRFGALGMVSLPDAAQAARDAEYVLDVLKLDGFGLVSHYDDIYLGDPDWNEFYAALDARKAVVFVHPVRPMKAGRAVYHFPSGFVELVAASGRVIANLLATGTLEKFPNIRWIIPHGGGIMTSILYRLSKFETMRAFKDKVPKGVDAYLSNIYFDVAQATDPVTLRSLFEVAPIDRVLFGTDYPQAIDIDNVVQDTIDGLDALPGFDAASRAKIMSGNALDLFPRLA
jgi:predicted TIM-barrel fold metal-dependent hydrolase